MESTSERNNENNRSKYDDPFRMNESLATRSFAGAEGNCTFILKDVRLYCERSGQQSAVLINSSLPQTEWYDLVELVQSPENPRELWLSIGGRELHRSTDGGAHFEKLDTVTAVADISFVPSQRSDCRYFVHILGRVNGNQGTFISWNQGKSWCPFDLIEYLPLA